MPTRGVPDAVVRALARVIPALRPLTPLLGRDLTFSADRARTELGFAPRPVEATILDCAATLQKGSSEATPG